MGHNRWVKKGILPFMLIFLGVSRATCAGNSSEFMQISGSHKIVYENSILQGDKDRARLDTAWEEKRKLEYKLALSAYGYLTPGWFWEGVYDENLLSDEMLDLKVWGQGFLLVVGPQQLQLDKLQEKYKRWLIGLGIEAKTPYYEVNLGAGTPQGVPKRQAFYGEGHKGPYILAGSIIPGTLRVKLDGRFLDNDEDYQINTSLGHLYFTQPIPSFSLIEVEYEAKTQESRELLAADVLYSLPNGLNASLFLVREQLNQIPILDESGDIPSDHYLKRHFLAKVGLDWRLNDNLQIVFSQNNSEAENYLDEIIDGSARELNIRWHKGPFRWWWEHQYLSSGFIRWATSEMEDFNYRSSSVLEADLLPNLVADVRWTKSKPLAEGGSDTSQMAGGLTIKNETSFLRFGLTEVIEGNKTSSQIGVEGELAKGDWLISGYLKESISLADLQTEKDILSEFELKYTPNETSSVEGYWKQNKKSGPTQLNNKNLKVQFESGISPGLSLKGAISQAFQGIGNQNEALLYHLVQLNWEGEAISVEFINEATTTRSNGESREASLLRSINLKPSTVNLVDWNAHFSTGKTPTTGIKEVWYTLGGQITFNPLAQSRLVTSTVVLLADTKWHGGFSTYLLYQPSNSLFGRIFYRQGIPTELNLEELSFEKMQSWGLNVRYQNKEKGSVEGILICHRKEGNPIYSKDFTVKAHLLLGANSILGMEEGIQVNPVTESFKVSQKLYLNWSVQESIYIEVAAHRRLVSGTHPYDAQKLQIELITSF